MTEREKLLDLIIAAKRDDPETGSFTEWLADYLLANGVTVQKWIPASKPPKEEGSYLVCSKTGKVYTSHYYTEKKCSEWYTRKAEWSHPNVTHWMPLPEPPKEEP